MKDRGNKIEGMVRIKAPSDADVNIYSQSKFDSRKQNGMSRIPLEQSLLKSHKLARVVSNNAKPTKRTLDDLYKDGRNSQINVLYGKERQNYNQAKL